MAYAHSTQNIPSSPSDSISSSKWSRLRISSIFFFDSSSGCICLSSSITFSRMKDSVHWRLCACDTRIDKIIGSQEKKALQCKISSNHCKHQYSFPYVSIEKKAHKLDSFNEQKACLSLLVSNSTLEPSTSSCINWKLVFMNKQIFSFKNWLEISNRHIDPVRPAIRPPMSFYNLMSLEMLADPKIVF